MKKEALNGIRIVDLTQIWAGSFASRILADMGAQVIKIEATRRYDSARNYGTLPDNQPGERPYYRRAQFNLRNRNKLSITLDLKSDKGKEIFKRLVAISDAVMENFSARVMSSLGLDYPVLRQVKPDILMISMPGFGMTGPEKDYVGQGSNLSGLSGLMSLCGYSEKGPHQIGAYTDHVAAVLAPGALMAALFHHRRTGEGQYIDLAQVEASARFMGAPILDYIMNGRLSGPRGNRHPWMAPHGCYPTKGEDAWVAIAVASEDQWHALCEASGHLEWANDPLFATSSDRWEHQDELDTLIAKWTHQRDHYEVMHLLQQAGVSCGAVLTSEELVEEDPHLKARNYFWQATAPEALELGVHPMPGKLWEFSKTPATLRSCVARNLGEHNSYVFGELLGISQDEMAVLEAEGVIGTEPELRTGMWVTAMTTQDKTGEGSSNQRKTRPV